MFTIASGVTHLDPTIFVVGSVLSRGLRFFVVAAILRRYGEPLRAFVENHLGKVTVAFAVLLVGGFVLIRLLG